MIRLSGCFDGEESVGLPVGNMVGSRDVNCEADDIVNVEVVQATGVDRIVDNQLRSFSERDITIKEDSWWD